MPITFTSTGSASNTNGTAATTASFTTVNGRLYAVVSAGASHRNGGVNYYDALTVTTSGGATVTQRAFRRQYNDRTPLAAIHTFVGNGNAQTVTVTMGSIEGSPIAPVVWLNVFEVTGSVSTDRSATGGGDVGAGSYTVTGTVSGSAVTGNVTLGVLNAAAWISGGATSPNGGETELAEATVDHTTGGGYQNNPGASVHAQAQVATGLSHSWSVSADDVTNAWVVVEFVEQPAPSVSIGPIPWK